MQQSGFLVFVFSCLTSGSPRELIGNRYPEATLACPPPGKVCGDEILDRHAQRLEDGDVPVSRAAGAVCDDLAELRSHMALAKPSLPNALHHVS